MALSSIGAAVKERRDYKIKVGKGSVMPRGILARQGNRRARLVNLLRADGDQRGQPEDHAAAGGVAAAGRSMA
jgi:hypothetical protein